MLFKRKFNKNYLSFCFLCLIGKGNNVVVKYFCKTLKLISFVNNVFPTIIADLKEIYWTETVNYPCAFYLYTKQPILIIHKVETVNYPCAFLIIHKVVKKTGKKYVQISVTYLFLIRR